MAKGDMPNPWPRTEIDNFGKVCSISFHWTLNGTLHQISSADVHLDPGFQWPHVQIRKPDGTVHNFDLTPWIATGGDHTFTKAQVNAVGVTNWEDMPEITFS